MPDTTKLLLSIEGMNCDGCAKKITAALQAVPGVQSATVNLAEKSAAVSLASPPPAPRDLMSAIKSAGFAPTGFSRPAKQTWINPPAKLFSRGSQNRA